METAYGYHYDQFKIEDNIFCTYYYTRSTEKFLKDFNKKDGTWKGLITIDSGAHSFFSFIGLSVSADNSQSQGEMPDPYEYFEKHLAWIKEWYDYADYFAELDLQDIVGQEQVWEWRKRYKEAGVSDKIITVHHSMNTMDDFKRMVRESDSKYVALEGLRGGKVNLPYMQLIRHAYENDTKVHGFALTNQKIMKKYPFYSVDSSSWTAVNRYGLIYKFEDGRMRQFKTKKEHFFEKNLSLQQASFNREKENQHFKLADAQVAFRKMEKYFGALWKKRGIDWDTKE